MARGTRHTHQASQAGLRVRHSADEIRALVSGRGRAPTPTRQYTHRLAGRLPDRADGAYTPSTRTKDLGLDGRFYEPADWDWHGCAKWLLDTRRASGRLVPAHARRTHSFQALTDAGSLRPLVDTVSAKVTAGFFTPVAFSEPREYETARETVWLRALDRPNPGRFDPHTLVDAHVLAHVTGLLEDADWALVSYDMGELLVQVAGGAPSAILAARRMSSDYTRLR